MYFVGNERIFLSFDCLKFSVELSKRLLKRFTVNILFCTQLSIMPYLNVSIMCFLKM